MVDIISGFIGNDYIATIITAFIPLIELKGGIIFARGAGLDFFTAFILAFLGSSLAFFLVFFLFIPILKLLKKIRIFKKFADKIEDYFKSKANSSLKNPQKGKTRSENFYKALSVFIFVAIPLPMTGVWTGTAIAVFLNMKFKNAVLPVLLGNFVAGLLISLLAESVLLIWGNIAILDYILYGLLALALIALIVAILKIFLTKKDTAEEK